MNMLSDNQNSVNIEDYKALEISFHRDLMNICRKYVNHLSLVSIIGTIETTKQETIELVRATTRSSFHEENPQDNEDKGNMEF